MSPIAADASPPFPFLSCAPAQVETLTLHLNQMRIIYDRADIVVCAVHGITVGSSLVLADCQILGRTRTPFNPLVSPIPTKTLSLSLTKGHPLRERSKLFPFPADERPPNFLLSDGKLISYCGIYCRVSLNFKI